MSKLSDSWRVGLLGVAGDSGAEYYRRDRRANYENSDVFGKKRRSGTFVYIYEWYLRRCKFYQLTDNNCCLRWFKGNTIAINYLHDLDQ